MKRMLSMAWSARASRAARTLLTMLVGIGAWVAPSRAEPAPKVPRFSVDYMDRLADPGTDFFRFAAGAWIHRNPVPADKSRWSGFDELQERNWFLVRQILEECATNRAADGATPSRQVGDLFLSAMDTNRLERLGLKPLRADLRRIDRLRNRPELFTLLAEFHLRGVAALFAQFASPDARQSDRYAFYVGQGGLGLPSRDYYFEPGFARIREAYPAHVARMLQLLGDSPRGAAAKGRLVLELETELAKVSKTPSELRDALANYNKMTVDQAVAQAPAIAWRAYLGRLGLPALPELVVRQPRFFAGVSELVQRRPMAEWKTYLRWHLIRSSAPYLHGAAEREWFAFSETVVKGTPEMEPRWQRAAKTIDGSLGEALGRLYVERHFPPAARARMGEMIGHLKAVFRDRLRALEWMSEETRRRAAAKFDRFTQKIGHPDSFRDYSRVLIRPDDYLGNVQRAARFEAARRLARVGQPVDRTEWNMTPQTVNAYFSPTMNEIVFPAGILQPPFFDLELDDAVNYGAIGVVIGHEITHGYDDQGRRYDAQGNLNDWWTAADAREFQARARKLEDQYGAYEALPGLRLNGLLTLGENIADLGGASLAFEALQRALAADPSKRRVIDGFTPEQRFFLSLAQLWRVNWREAELRRRVTVDPHSPGQFRAFGPHVNLDAFFAAFGIGPAAPLYRPPEARARIW